MQKYSKLYRTTTSLGTGLVVLTISATVLWQKPLFWEAVAWQLLILLAILISTNHQNEDFQQTVRRFAFWSVLPLVFMLSWRVPLDVFFIYTIVWIACTPFFLPTKHCWAWLLMINLMWFGFRQFHLQEAQPLIETLLISTFFIFALLSSISSKESDEANQKTQQLNRELLATQHLLGEATRESERTRIARDLHDLLGHHLTALTINLQVASHISNDEAKQSIDQCHALSKLLLNDVREAVSTLRDMPVVNLRELLEIAIRDIPRLTISLEVEEELQLDDVNTAEVLLRLVQESITNTLKHTDAHQANITVCKEPDQVTLRYSDSGGGCQELEPGNGITGMRERVQRLGGELLIESSPTFSLTAIVPLKG